MDMTLPGIDGLEATRRIRARIGPAVRVIGVSGRSSDEQAARARAAGMDAYLPKPVSPSALARVLSRSDRQRFIEAQDQQQDHRPDGRHRRWR